MNIRDKFYFLTTLLKFDAFTTTTTPLVGRDVGADEVFDQVNVLWVGTSRTDVVAAVSSKRTIQWEIENGNQFSEKKKKLEPIQ